MSPGETINDAGLAFIRRAGGEGLSVALSGIREVVGDRSGFEVRSEEDEEGRAPALYLLSSGESRRREELLELSAHMAVEKVIDKVPGLMETYDVTFDSVAVYSNWRREKFVVVKPTVIDHRPLKERIAILRVLDTLTPGTKRKWQKRVPDITLVYAGPKVEEEEVNELANDIKETALPATFALGIVLPTPRY